MTKGFTIAELLVSLCLLAVLTSATYRLLDTQRRISRDHLARSDLYQNIRTVAALLPQEFQPLDASDPAGSDLVAMEPSSITYRRERNTYFLCRPPDSGTMSVTLDARDWLGPDPIDIREQSYALFAEGDPGTAADDSWLHVEAVSQAGGAACPSGAPSTTLTLTGVTAVQLSAVSLGAPIQGFTLERVMAYRDGSGDWWIGSQRAQHSTGNWAAIQPIAGPLAPAGLQFSFFNPAGIVTNRTDEVARIQVIIVARTERLVTLSRGLEQYGTAAATLQIALRNNRRP